MAVRIKDIARLAKVSEATVSLALNNKSIVREETRKRIQALAAELGFSPNAMARGLVQQKSRTIGLIVPDIENLYYAKLVKHVDERVREAGLALIMAISDDKPEVESKIVDSFISERVEGVLVVPVNQVNKDTGYFEKLKKHDIPCVCVTSYYAGSDLPYVMTDIEEGMYKLTGYLLDMGHREIYFLCGALNVLTTSLRVGGYTKAFAARDLAVDGRKFIECRNLNYEGAQEEAIRLLREKVKMDAVIAINDFMAVGFLNILKESGIRVPGDISLAGFDNTVFSSIAGIPLTTVSQDIRRMGVNSVEMLLKRIEKGDSGFENMVIKPELIIRESTMKKK